MHYDGTEVDVQLGEAEDVLTTVVSLATVLVTVATESLFL
jgi:hypothetical protein